MFLECIRSILPHIVTKVSSPELQIPAGQSEEAQASLAPWAHRLSTPGHSPCRPPPGPLLPAQRPCPDSRSRGGEQFSIQESFASTAMYLHTG